MISMKLKKSERNDVPVCESTSEGPEYPWGLKLNLEKDVLKKIGKKASGFKVGAKGKVVAEFYVSDVSVSEYKDSDGHESVGLQITAIEFEEKHSNKVQALRKIDNKIGGIV